MFMLGHRRSQIFWLWDVYNKLFVVEEGLISGEGWLYNSLTAFEGSDMSLFLFQAAFEEGWSSNLMSAYYPLLLSGSSLIVCFWAEASSQFYVLLYSKYQLQKPSPPGFVIQWFVSHGCPPVMLEYMQISI